MIIVVRTMHIVGQMSVGQMFFDQKMRHQLSSSFLVIIVIKCLNEPLFVKTIIQMSSFGTITFALTTIALMTLMQLTQLFKMTFVQMS